MNVLVIPEDFRKDQYILKPIIEAMLAEVGKPRANVRVCQDPLLGGIDQAMNWEQIQEIIDRYKGMVHVFFLIVDRDGNAGRRQALNAIQDKAIALLAAGRAFAENAWQEVEVWVLAGHDLPNDWAWAEVRQEVHAKERYFEPFATVRGLSNEPGGGRKTLAREAVSRYGRIRQLCPEDIGALEEMLKHSGAIQ